MRATLVGVCGLLLLALFVTRVTRPGAIDLRFVPESLRLQPNAAETAPAPAPAPVPADATEPAAEPTVEAPQVLSAGELSVVDDDVPEPIVRYVDSAGSIRMVRGLANVPAAYRGDAVVLGPGHVNLVNVPAPSAVAFRDWQPEPNRNRHDVVLYGASWCGACKRARRYLDREGVRYDERDIDDDDGAREQVMRTLGRIAIPLLEVDGRYVSGFRPDIYARVLH